MPEKNNNKKILIAPLDWGLGHATRCIPLIKYLIKNNYEVFIASSGDQLALLQKEFPHLQSFSLKGYNIKYSNKKRFFSLKIIFQIPKILAVVYKEHRWLQRIINDHHINYVISDNRYGLHTGKIPCVFITHQLAINIPFPWLANLARKVNYSYIEKFTECWVPDFVSDLNISGKLGHPAYLPSVPVHYIGPLSRFAVQQENKKKYHFLILISGPEPQRSIFEKKMLAVIPKLDCSCILVRGKPLSGDNLANTDNCRVYNHLSTAELQKYFIESEYIITRAGYTTIMEILSMQKKSILIPTPGQTEQEYLALRLMQQQWCFSCEQESDLQYCFNEAESFAYRLPGLQTADFSITINDFLQKSVS